MWFRTENNKLGDKKKRGPKSKFTDEYLINLVNENPNLSLIELAEIVGTSITTILRRINQIKDNGKRIDYCSKKTPKFTDEYLIDLINNNPHLSMAELGRITVYQKKHIPEGFNQPLPNPTDEFLINLIKENLDLSIEKLVPLAGISSSTISNKIRKINKSSKTPIYQRKDIPKLTREVLIDSINKNPKLNTTELAELTGVSANVISEKIRKINMSGKSANYTKKTVKKFSDEVLIELVNKNPELGTKELAEIMGVSKSTVVGNIRKINNSSEGIKCIMKRSQKISDESLIELVNKNSELDMKELAKLASVSIATMYRRIKQINSNGVVINYFKKRTSDNGSKIN
ncbi:hypothetical protein CONCODRAFT_11663 [Conidiobolus coronatus NRRL 28638]|uniref:Helix-turn-helix type 11 domain-containing protein n=1 Tax=Conidiobolus coronatus (strain ATCC 28846 / CBS 209.66 / NRRL 28638) TaxID=796925 RepID=A0A137NUJ7_CONC2|nr:hypothetical protein CONCODRAFT_11663 [Conidiobolus coronatus NRRL 28638]|eukprot:KXN66485.1 hypothetical protein CONCODRAFT_11663 [Conidiobolus coronatus NRRL 28638]